MCGIFGFLLNRPLKEEDMALGQEGTNALRHRGPDHTDHWADAEGGLFLGHTRLSIIDLSDDSNQPMVRDGSVLVYNGEIYNYQELARDLGERGIPMTTSGDVEVLLQSWLRWGADCLNRFDGMFAFALYHGRRLHLATDPFGEKPLYWVKNSDGFYFSSEPGPLVELLDVKPEFTQKDITAFLYNVVPNLSRFDIRAEAANGVPVAPAYVIWTIVYGTVYTIFFLILAAIAFQDKDV